MPRGGRRQGAGRKPGVSRFIGPISARELLEELDWKAELKSLYSTVSPDKKLAILTRLLEFAAPKPSPVKADEAMQSTEKTRVIVKFWEPTDQSVGLKTIESEDGISKPESGSLERSIVTVKDLDTPGSSRVLSGPLGSSRKVQ